MPRLTLIIIDMLNDFFRQHARLAEQRPHLIASIGTDLDATLKNVCPDLVVVAGINTHACVRTTVIDAYQRL